jgi:hypothetical protein
MSNKESTCIMILNNKMLVFTLLFILRYTQNIHIYMIEHCHQRLDQYHHHQQQQPVIIIIG